MFSNLDLSFDINDTQSIAQYNHNYDRRPLSYQTGATPGLSLDASLADISSGHGGNKSPRRQSLAIVSENNWLGPRQNTHQAANGSSGTPSQRSPTDVVLSAYPASISSSSGTTPRGPTHNQMPIEDRDKCRTVRGPCPSDTTAESANNSFIEDSRQAEMQGDPPLSCSAFDITAWVRKLSDINVQLYQHVARISSLHDLRSKASITSEALGTDAKNGKRFAIDQTFKLSLLLIEALNHLYSRLLYTSSSHALPNSPPNSGGTTSGPYLPGTASLDQGSILLVLSSYLRLIEAYDITFRSVQASLTENQAAMTGKEAPRHLALPQLTIGAFSPPASSAVQITLIVHLGEMLLAQIRRLIGSMESSAGLDSGAEGGGESLGDTTLRAIRAKESETMKRINSIKRICSSRVDPFEQW